MDNQTSYQRHPGAAYSAAQGGPQLEGERVLYTSRGSPWLVVLRPMTSYLLVIGVTAMALTALRQGWVSSSWLPASWPTLDEQVIYAFGAALLALALMWSLADWLSRRYTLTDRRVMRSSGVIRRTTVEYPLDQVQSILLHVSIPERPLGLGTPVFSCAGSGVAGEFTWLMVSKPKEVIATVRSAVETHTARSHLRHIQPPRPLQPPMQMPPPPPPPPAYRRPIIIGLSGAIGAGKSAAAAEFARMGCFVADSDAAARDALARPDVAATLAQWWGPGVLDAQGRPDRAAVAAIVFADPAQRTRLEQLTHPIIAQHRAAVIDHAARVGAPAVIVDAPLLFEAGLERACDTTIYIDAPLAVRQARVAATRGWSSDELARREAAQWPADEKRRRANFVIHNHADPAALAAAVQGCFGAILAQVRPMPPVMQ